MASYDSPIRANIKVHKVFERAKPDGKGGHFNELWIKYSPGTDSHLVEIEARVDDIRPEDPMEGAGQSRINDPHSAVGNMKRVSWEAMKPYIDAYTLGKEVPVHGIPLGQWPALDPQRSEIFRAFGLRTIEELIAAPESKVIAIASRMPDVRRYREMAENFLKAQSASASAAEIEARDNKISDLEGQVSEMRDMLAQLLNAAQTGQAETPKRRGRPSVSETVEADAA